MKTTAKYCLVLTCAALSLASARADAVLHAVGPEPGSSTARYGGLIVYTATVPSLAEANAAFDWDNNRNLHTNYVISRPGDTRTLKVVNSFGPNDEYAKVVPLPAGRYLVRAQSQRDGVVTVPVVIQPHCLTEVKLGNSLDAPTEFIPPVSAVLTPSGRVVGWQAREARVSTDLKNF
jgi:hypothetical protein